MAVTTERSTQVTNAEDGVKTGSLVYPADNVGNVKVAAFDFTQGAAAGDATSTADLCILPPGRKRVLVSLSDIGFSAFGSSRVLDIGWEAHTTMGGTAVVADDNGLSDNIDVSSAGSAVIGGAAGNDKSIVIDSNAPVKIFATVAGGTIPAAATLNGQIAFVVD